MKFNYIFHCFDKLFIYETKEFVCIRLRNSWEMEILNNGEKKIKNSLYLIAHFYKFVHKSI